MKRLLTLLALMLLISPVLNAEEYDRHCRNDCEPVDKTGKRVGHGHDDGRATNQVVNNVGGAGGVGESSATASGGSGGVATTGASTSHSDVTVEAASDDNSSGATNDTVITGGDTTLYTINEYEAVSQAVSSLNLAYCSDGAGAQAVEGGFSVAGINYICEIVMALPVVMSTVQADIANGNLEEARATMAEVRAMTHEAYDYIDTRGTTAPLGGFFRDTWWIIGLLVLL